MEQAALDHTSHVDPPGADQFNATSKAGWVWFTKFLLWNVVTCVVALLFIGLLTVWS